MFYLYLRNPIILRRSAFEPLTTVKEPNHPPSPYLLSSSSILLAFLLPFISDNLIQHANNFQQQQQNLTSQQMMMSMMQQQQQKPMMMMMQQQQQQQLGVSAILILSDLSLLSKTLAKEGPNMNVVFVVNGGKELVMPRFDNVLSGCTAKRTLTLAKQLVSKGMLTSVKVMDVTVEVGKKADEMMLIGSGVLIKHVIQWDEQIIGDGKEGPIAKALLDLLLEDMWSVPPSVRVLIPY